MKANPFSLNPKLSALDVYASKAISMQAKSDPAIANLSFGEPEFGPPDYLLEGLAENELSLKTFLASVKRYEDPKGALRLREAVALWYAEHYNLAVDPEKEIMITHGGVEAITIALLATTAPGDAVAVCDPSYMLYKRTVEVLGRKAQLLPRPADEFAYSSMIADEFTRAALVKSKAFIINSPENPTGYVLHKNDWEALGACIADAPPWIIHDEVYDTMTFGRPHQPARKMPSLAKRSILVNSFSKKFGIPGLRIGWLVASEDVIEAACKAHDYLYLGVNIQYEEIATRLLTDDRRFAWLTGITALMRERAERAVEVLGTAEGFRWPYKPTGAMFLFPDVGLLHAKLPERYKGSGEPVGDAVARYLLEEKKVAVVPGSVYGHQGDNHIRMVLCTAAPTLELAFERLKRSLP